MCFNVHDRITHHITLIKSICYRSVNFVQKNHIITDQPITYVDKRERRDKTTTRSSRVAFLRQNIKNHKDSSSHVNTELRVSAAIL